MFMISKYSFAAGGVPWFELKTSLTTRVVEAARTGRAGARRNEPANRGSASKQQARRERRRLVNWSLLISKVEVALHARGAANTRPHCSLCLGYSQVVVSDQR